MDGKLRNMTSIYLTQGDKVLLLYRQGGRVVSDTWVASAGGHFEPYELNDARACVLRELREEIGLGENNLQNLHLRYITLRHTKGEIRQNYYFFAELTAKLPDVSSNEGTLQWFELSDTASLEMPFTAKFVLDHYRTTGRRTQQLYGGVADGSRVQFIELPEF